MSDNSDKRRVSSRVARGIAGVLAMAAIVAGAVAAGLTIFPRVRGGPEPTLDPDLVAVATLENQTGDASLDPLGRQAAARITEAVHRHGVAEVVATEAALAAADAPKRLQGSEAASALARASGAGVIIHGTYYLVGDSLEFQIRITDVAQEQLMSAPRPLMAHRESSDDALRLVQERTLGSLAAALDYRAGDLNFPTQPPSLEAYRLYRQGQEAWDRIEFEEALGYYEQARAMDSRWMSPLLYVSLTLMNLRRYAEGDSALRVAASHRAHMSEPEDILLQVLRSHLDDEDPTVKLRGIRRLVTIAPAIGLRWGYFIASQAYRPQESLDFLARVDTASPSFERYEREYWTMTATQHHILGQHEEELQVAEEARRRLPDDMIVLHYHLVALAALGRTAEIEALLDTVFALPGTREGEEEFVPHWRALKTAWELRAHGHSGAARTAVLERGLEWLEARPPEWRRQNQSEYRRAKANFLYGLGRWEEARKLYELLYGERAEDPERSWALQEIDATELLPGLAGAAARLGEPERARAISAELAQRTEEVLSDIAVSRLAGALLIGQARIAAALGEPEEAVRLLRESFRLSRHKGGSVFALHRYDDFESLHDYLPYQQFLKPRG